MSKDITYRCNLCRLTSDSNGVVGIIFVGVHSVKADMAICAENHLCKKCISALAAEMSRLCRLAEVSTA